MITMKEYRECKEKVNDFERSVIVAAIVTGKLVNASIYDVTAVVPDSNGGIWLHVGGNAHHMSGKELRSMMKGGGRWVVDFKGVWSDKEYRIFDDKKSANRYYDECMARTAECSEEGDDYDIEWVDINWYDWADFPEEALDYADL